ncbi:MAG: hypothetical protein ABIW84_01545 [Ilumatobacteraceae bacterium]
MKLIGTGTFDANRTTMTNSLAAAMLTRPEISANVVNLFETSFSAFSSYLARRGMNKKGLYEDFNSSNFKVIGNRKFMWALKGYPFRKGTIVTTVASTPTSTLNNLVFNLDLDTNYFSPNDNLELKDRRTIIQIMDDYPVEITSGTWRYRAKMVSNATGSFVPQALLTAGAEVGFSHTAFHELSETGYEKNTFPEWHTNYLTIQRMQYSISGSANETVLWVEHNGQKLWVKSQDMEMMRRWAYARENQLLYGKASIDANENVYLRDLHGREIIQGDGLLAQGDGSLKYQYNTLNIRVLENILQNLQLLSTADGLNEVFVMGGQAFVWNFQRLMRDVFKFNPEPLFVTEADKKQGVKVAFTSYEMGGMKLIVSWNPAFDAAWRPQDRDVNGVSKESHRGIFVNLGNTIGGDPMVELVTLGKRSMVRKTIDGMASPGGNSKEFASNSMDGYQVQILSETGIRLGNPFGVAELFKP